MARFGAPSFYGPAMAFSALSNALGNVGRGTLAGEKIAAEREQREYERTMRPLHEQALRTDVAHKELQTKIAGWRQVERSDGTWIMNDATGEERWIAPVKPQWLREGGTAVPFGPFGPVGQAYEFPGAAVERQAREAAAASLGELASAESGDPTTDSLLRALSRFKNLDPRDVTAIIQGRQRELTAWEREQALLDRFNRNFGFKESVEARRAAEAASRTKDRDADRAMRAARYRDLHDKTVADLKGKSVTQIRAQTEPQLKALRTELATLQNMRKAQQAHDMMPSGAAPTPYKAADITAMIIDIQAKINSAESAVAKAIKDAGQSAPFPDAPPPKGAAGTSGFEKKWGQ